ncbi:hypothetical protein HK105_205570 [Polyrhizophydium stewartii]|uniref:ER-bound oxygenase mpaB/mpaB'/Rubber oxygenase catalytic domain-containing protein n=1 Tax=Polyrhizophydium stewartii TaxID=2732419 RepID=A0ABR4N5L6_9FUNG
MSATGPRAEAAVGSMAILTQVGAQDERSAVLDAASILLLLVVGLYLGLVVIVRFSRRDAAARAAEPTPARLDDAFKLAHSLGYLEFPTLFYRAIEGVYLRSYAIPSVAAVFAASGEIERNPAVRYDHTDILIREITEHPPSSERARTAIRRINYLHALHKIQPDDMRFMLYLFIVQPVRLIERFGWRRLHPNEVKAHVILWRAIGQNMGVQDIPTSLAEIDHWATEYEMAHAKHSDEAKRLSEASIALFLSQQPAIVRPLARQMLATFFPPHIRAAIGLESPMPGITAATHAGMLAWAVYTRWFKLPRERAGHRTPSRPDGRGLYCPVFHVYSDALKGGYTIERIGPKQYEQDEALGPLYPLSPDHHLPASAEHDVWNHEHHDDSDTEFVRGPPTDGAFQEFEADKSIHGLKSALRAFAAVGDMWFGVDVLHAWLRAAWDPSQAQFNPYDTTILFIGAFLWLCPAILIFFFIAAVSGQSMQRLMSAKVTQEPPHTPPALYRITFIARARSFPFWFESGVLAAMFHVLAIPEFAAHLVGGDGDVDRLLPGLIDEPDESEGAVEVTLAAKPASGIPGLRKNPGSVEAKTANMAQAGGITTKDAPSALSEPALATSDDANDLDSDATVANTDIESPSHSRAPSGSDLHKLAMPAKSAHLEQHSSRFRHQKSLSAQLRLSADVGPVLVGPAPDMSRSSTVSSLPEVLRDPATFLDSVELLIYELVENEMGTKRSMRTLQRLSYLRAVSDLTNEQCLYLVCLFATTPCDWINRFAHRRLGRLETEAFYILWAEVAVRIGLTGVPTSLAGMREYARAFEASRVAPTRTGQVLAHDLLNMILMRTRFDTVISVRNALGTFLPRRVAQALALPRAPYSVMTLITRAAIAVTGMYMFALMDFARTIARRTGRRTADGYYIPNWTFGRVYSCGYVIEELGPARLASDRSLGPLYEVTPKTFSQAGPALAPFQPHEHMCTCEPPDSK